MKARFIIEAVEVMKKASNLTYLTPTEEFAHLTVQLFIIANNLEHESGVRNFDVVVEE